MPCRASRPISAAITCPIRQRPAPSCARAPRSTARSIRSSNHRQTLRESAVHGLGGSSGHDRPLDGACYTGQDDDRAHVRGLLCGTALAAALWAGTASAEWSISVDVERFRWQEATSPSVTETGPRFGMTLEYEQLREAGWQFAYRGHFRHGTIDYSGSFLFDPNQKATARTEYNGLTNEVQGSYRFPGPLGFEVLAGLAWDLWQRNILPDQKEDYSVFFARVGVNFDPRSRHGFFAGVGMKLPFYVAENAYLNELGFNQNPTLEPKGQPSPYAQVGYRFSPQWSVIGYYDTYRFGESKAVPATHRDFPGTTFLIFQPASNIDTLGVRVRYSFR